MDLPLPTVAGLRIYGTPWTPPLAAWAWEALEDELQHHSARIPTGIDILITHCPPRGYGDLVRHYDIPSQRVREERAGSSSLMSSIDRAQPQLVVCGHVHEGRVCWQRGPSTIANVSVVDEACDLRWSAQAFEIEPQGRS